MLLDELTNFVADVQIDPRHRSFPQIREILVCADAHRSLDCVIPHEKLGQRQGMAFCAVSQIDAADFVAKMSRLRDEVP